MQLRKCGMIVCKYMNRNMNDLTNVTYRMQYKEKNTTPNGRFLVFGTGFLLGLVFFYFMGRNLLENGGFLSQTDIERLKKFSMNERGYLMYIAEIRIKHFLFILFGSLSIWSGFFFYAVLGWSGFQLGILSYTAMYQYGMRGVLYCIFMLIPHGIFYFLALVKVMNRKMENDKKYYHKNINITKNKVMYLSENVKFTITIFLLLCLGILSESYINPWFMKWILLFF